jgi:hypothetical protein
MTIDVMPMLSNVRGRLSLTLRPKPKRKRLLVVLLTSSLAVAVIGSVLDKFLIPFVSHRAVGPKYVSAAARVDDDAVLIFVRNNSDEPLDLKEAVVEIDGVSPAGDGALGAYPDVSQVYRVVASPGVADLQETPGQVVVKVKIAQAIAPGSADQFSVRLVGSHGPARLGSATVKVNLVDLRGTEYSAR